MNIRFTKLAQREFDEVVNWYQSKGNQLDTQFILDFNRTIRRMIAYPLSCTPIKTDKKRCLLSKFPYGIIFQMDNQTIIVLAVMHLHREPDYWIDREAR